MKRVALIPARAGSKRIPGKNVRPFCGRPILEYSLEAATAAETCDHVVVSTDDDRVAQIARAFGATVLERPPALADDTTPLIDVVLHVLAAVEADEVCLLLATAPFVTPQLINEAHEAMITHGAQGAMTMAAFDTPIQRAFEQRPDGSVAMMWPQHMFTRSQDLPEALYDAGQLYWLQADAVRDQRKVYLDRMACVRLPRASVQDIDTEEDWAFAELLYQRLGPEKR